jgi:hypothetical protein
MPIVMKTVLAEAGRLRERGGGTFLVLLLLEVANHLTEQGLVLGVQWLRHGGRWLG